MFLKVWYVHIFVLKYEKLTECINRMRRNTPSDYRNTNSDASSVL